MVISETNPDRNIHNDIKIIPVGEGHLSAAAQGPKFKIPLPSSFVPDP